MEDDLPKSLTDLLIDMIMKFLTAILTTAILAFAAGLFLPWWSVAIAAFVVALVMKQSSWKSALAVLSFNTAFMVSPLISVEG